MLVEVKVPQLPESVTEAILLTWHFNEGDYVERDQNLIDLETDKVVLELPAPDSGVLVKIILANGSTAKSLELLAQIDTEAKGAAKSAPAEAASAPVAAPAPSVAAAATADTSNQMPAARKMIADQGLNAEEIAGTGRGGRITKEDVLGHQSAPKPASAALATPVAVDVDQLLGDRPEQRVPMSRLRARVAERLIQSQSTAAILTTFNEVNMAPVMEMRNRYKDKFEKEHGVKLGFMSFFVKAAIAALKRYPVVNASIDGNDIVYHGYFDIGVAVGSPRGLVVPILRNADQMSLADIEKKIAEFGNRAKDGKLTIEELTGGTFSISNGGTFGSMMSTPIINPPQSAILGMHATKERAVVENGQVVVRPMMYLALSYDHRIIDGREAVLSLVAIKEAIEDPARLLLDV